MQEHTKNNYRIKKQSRLQWNVWLTIPIALGFMVLFILSMEWRETLKIDHIIIKGARIVHSEEIFSLSGVSSKARLFDVNIFDVQKKISQQPYMKSVLVRRQIPNALLIEIIEREPIASLNYNQLHYIDEEGFLLPIIQSPIQFDLPLISGIDDLKQLEYGRKIESGKLIQAIEVLKTALAVDSSVYHLISEIKIEDENEVVLYSTDCAVPIFLGTENIQNKLMTLKTFWENFVKSGEAEKLKYIDLRYEDQVVVKWNYQTENQTTKISLLSSDMKGIN